MLISYVDLLLTRLEVTEITKFDQLSRSFLIIYYFKPTRINLLMTKIVSLNLSYSIEGCFKFEKGFIYIEDINFI